MNLLKNRFPTPILLPCWHRATSIASYWNSFIFHSDLPPYLQLFFKMLVFISPLRYFYPASVGRHLNFLFRLGVSGLLDEILSLSHIELWIATPNHGLIRLTFPYLSLLSYCFLISLPANRKKEIIKHRKLILLQGSFTLNVLGSSCLPQLSINIIAYFLLKVKFSSVEYFPFSLMSILYISIVVLLHFYHTYPIQQFYKLYLLYRNQYKFHFEFPI